MTPQLSGPGVKSFRDPATPTPVLQQPVVRHQRPKVGTRPWRQEVRQRLDILRHGPARAIFLAAGPCVRTQPMRDCARGRSVSVVDDPARVAPRSGLRPPVAGPVCAGLIRPRTGPGLRSSRKAARGERPVGSRSRRAGKYGYRGSKFTMRDEFRGSGGPDLTLPPSFPNVLFGAGCEPGGSERPPVARGTPRRFC